MRLTDAAGIYDLSVDRNALSRALIVATARPPDGSLGLWFTSSGKAASSLKASYSLKKQRFQNMLPSFERRLRDGPAALHIAKVAAKRSLRCQLLGSL